MPPRKRTTRARTARPQGVIGVPVSSPYHKPLETPQQAFLAAYVAARDAGMDREAEAFLASVEPRPVGGVEGALRRAERLADNAHLASLGTKKEPRMADRVRAIQDLIRRW